MSGLPEHPLQSFSLEGRHIVLVGASSGLGADMAVVLSRMGASLTLMARRRPLLEDVLGRCTPGAHRAATVDVTETKAMEAAFVEAHRELGPVWGMVYLAGMNQLRPLPTIDDRHMDQMLGVNLKGGLHAARFAAFKGRMPAGGSILWVSSVQAHVAAGGGTALYAASKAGLEAAQRVLAVELAPRAVRVNSLVVGAVQTDIWETLDAELGQEILARTTARYPLGIGGTKDVALAAAFLLSDAARWITGAQLALDGGFLSHNRG